MSRMDDLHDEALAENAQRQERADQAAQKGQESPVDLAEARSLLGLSLPSQKPDAFPVGDSFESQPWDLGDDQDTGADRADRSSGKRYRPNKDLAGAVTTDGFSFGIQRFSNPDRPIYCKYCGNTLLSPAEVSPCEFETPAGEDVEYRVQAGGMPFRLVEFGEGPNRPGRRRLILSSATVHQKVRVAPPEIADSRSFGPDNCECNGCTIRREGIRKRGRPRVQCGAPECKRALKRDQKAKERKRGKK